MPLRICFYGGPGVGKSTLAAEVYAELSRGGIVSAELVQEFVKPWAHEQKKLDVFDQVFTFGNQLWAEHRLLRAGVDVIVTDSPIVLQCVYTAILDAEVGRHQLSLALRYEKEWKSLNFLVKRKVPYRRIGRYQDEPELAAIDNMILATLKMHEIPCIIVQPNDKETVLRFAKNAAYSEPNLRQGAT